MNFLPILLIFLVPQLLAAAPTTGDAVPELAPFDEMALKFLDEHQVPGMAIAVAKDGQLLYSRGFGLADKEKQTPVQPDALFRIASISKPITAVAVLRLVERDKLKLEDRIVDLLKLDIPAAPKGDPRWRDITILHLLQHSGGFDRGKSFDPMFKSREFALAQKTSSPAGQAEVVESMLSHPLDFEPGERHAYSNFGYCLLGRAIEKASGQSYDAYVKEHVLKPAGVTGMKIGATRTTASGEVRYYDRAAKTGPSVFEGPDESPKQVPRPYGVWNLETMDAHGGWIASAPDLLKFASIADGKAAGNVAGRPVLAAESIRIMFAPPLLTKPVTPKETTPDGKPAVHYGCGWSVRYVGSPKAGTINTWHLGGLDGTSTLLVRRFDGLSWAVLFNSDFTADGQWLASKIDPLMHAAAAKVKSWPKAKALHR